MTRIALIVGSCLMVVPAAAMAQTAPSKAPASAVPTVGATVLDSAGTPIGTISSITPQAIVLDMDGTKIAVPPTSIGSTPKGFAMAMTKAALQAAQAQQQAQAKAALQSRLVPGISVSGINGATIGTIKAADASLITLTTDKGEVKLPVNGFTMSQSGQVMVGMTEAQFDAAVSGAAAGAGAPATASDAPATDDAATSTSTGIAGTAGSTGTDTMTPPATPATTTMPAPTPTPTPKSGKSAMKKPK